MGAVLRQPLTQLTWGGAVAAALVARAMEGHSELPGSALEPGWVGLATAVGTWTAVWRLGWLSPWLGALTPAARLWTELAGIGCAVLVVSAPLAFVRHGLGGAEGVVATVAAWFHSAVLGVALLRLKISPRARLLLHVALAWCLPALWLEASGWRSAVARLTGQSGLWSPEGVEPLTPLPALVDMASVAALLGAAWLVLTSNPRRQCATAS